jgi:phytanoyl-CoA hydroxylase
MPTSADSIEIDIDAAAFERDGYLIVPSLFGANDAARIKTIAYDNMANKNNEFGVEVWQPDRVPDEIFRVVIRSSPMVAVLRALIGPNVDFLSIKPVLKSAAVTEASPWHQDRLYWGGSEKVSVWIALDRATVDNGCLKVVPGSHKMAFTHESVATDGFAHRITNETIADLPVTTAELEPGDALFFSDLTVHASHPNRIGADRWALIPTYRNADVPDESQLWADPLRVTDEPGA